MYQNRLLNIFSILYGWIIRLGSNLQSIFLFWMRLTWGHQFFLAGLKKFHNIPGTIDFFQSIHILHPEFTAYLVASIELIGGLLLILGFASRLVSIPLAIIMLTALKTAHWGDLSGFKIVLDPRSLVIQAPYPFLITSLLVFLFGPGRISIDAWIKRWAEKQPKY